MSTMDLLITLESHFIDCNGLVKPNINANDSANGVLFTSIAQLLSKSLYRQGNIDRCFIKPGLLARKPTPSSQEQWDDYLGIAVASIVTNQTKNPRAILAYGAKHAGFYNTGDYFTWTAFLWRFPIVFTFMFVAAFPYLKYLAWPTLAVYLRLMPIAFDGSGRQLQWLMYQGYNTAFHAKLNIGSIVPTFVSYYGIDHPFTQFAIANNL